MRKKGILLILILGLLLISTSAFPQLKKRVAVFTFENKAQGGWNWYTGGSAGEGMAEMLTTTLVSVGFILATAAQNQILPRSVYAAAAEAPPWKAVRFKRPGSRSDGERAERDMPVG